MDFRTKLARIFAGVMAIFVWTVLVVQFCLQLTNQSVDASTSERIVRFFSYFTTFSALLAFLVVGPIYVGVAKLIPARSIAPTT